MEQTALYEKPVTQKENWILRNLQITQSYHELTVWMQNVIGRENVSWVAFATYASKTAGHCIRHEQLPNAVNDLVSRLGGKGGPKALAHQYLMDPAARRGGSRHGLIENIYLRISRSVSYGNCIVYNELAPLFREFVDTFQYDATAKDLKIAYEAPGNCAPDLTWTCEILDGVSSTDVGQWVSLAYNGADYGVVYFDNYFGVNRYTYPAGGIFGEVIELIPGSVVGQVNSLIYQNNTAHVVYYRDVAGGRFGYAERVGSGGNCALSWKCSVIAAVGGAFSIDATLYSGLGLSYSSSATGLGYAHPVANSGNCGAGKWQCEAVNPNALPTSTSFHMARCGLLGCSTASQIAYYDYLIGALVYAERIENGQGNCPNNQNWNCWFIEFAGLPLQLIEPGLALVMDADNQPVILYQDFYEPNFTNSVVKAAWPDPNGNCGPNQNWRCVFVDSGYRAGTYLNVGAALDAELVDNRIYIAYYDTDNGDLLLAYEPAPAATVTPSPTIGPSPTPGITPTPTLLDEVIYLPLVER